MKNLLAQQDGSAGKGAAAKPSNPSLDLHGGRRGPILLSCPLTSTCKLC